MPHATLHPHHTNATPRPTGTRGAVLRTCGLVIGVMWAATLSLSATAGPAHTTTTMPSAQTTATAPLSAVPSVWGQLSPAQKAVLAPLQDRWKELDDTSRAKWAGVAARYPQLSPDEQARVRDRMTQWAKLPPAERGEARLRFQQSRQLSAAERHKQWEAYQALPPDTRNDLQRQGARRDKPVFLGDQVPGPREAKQAFAIKRNPASAQSGVKSNLVPSTNANTTVSAAVAPTVVKAGPGATTTLMTERPSPSLHQQPGLPKIAASKGFVDPVTMLPQRGAQSAGMSPVASAVAASSSVNAARTLR